MTEWINANERLPENDDRVLACCNGDIFFARYDNSLNAWKRVPLDIPLPQVVSYWMPLPKPPQ